MSGTDDTPEPFKDADERFREELRIHMHKEFDRTALDAVADGADAEKVAERIGPFREFFDKFLSSEDDDDEGEEASA